MNLYKGDNTFELYYGTGSYPKVSSRTANTIYNVEIKKRLFYINGSLLYDFNNSSNTYTFNTTKTIYLFGLNYDSGSYSACKFYSAIIKQNDILIRNMIPCYRRSDIKPGMYDTVNDVFYTNNGSGEFTVGPNV